MPALQQITTPQVRRLPKFLPAFIGMILFWSVFDGILIYVAPIAFSQAGLTNSELGLVLGSSSFTGAWFDLLLSKIVKNPHYRRFFLVFFAVCFLVPLVLWQANSIPLFLLVMALWGIYFDLLNFGNFDFISRHFNKDRSTFAFSLVLVVKSLGYIIAPIIAGIAVADTVDPQIFVLMWIMIFISFLFFLSLIFWTKDTFLTGPSAKEEAQPKSFTREAIAWSKLFRVIWSPLIFICFFAIYDSFFYTIGPLMAESYQGIGIYSGLILAAYWVPTFLVSMFTQRLTRRFGKKRTAYFGLLIAALPLLIFFVGDSPVLAAAIFFVSASFSSFSVPAISSAYTDYINEAHKYEEEIEAISDFLDNLGYIVGPIIAGVLADRVGYEFSFGWLGIGLIVTLLLLVKLTPKHIRISNRVID